MDQRFFCHHCSVEIPRIEADYTCPTCNSGFIEELSGSRNIPTEDDDMHGGGPHDLGHGLENDPNLGPLMDLLPGLIGGGPSRQIGSRGRGRTRIQIHRGGHPGNPPRQNLGMDQAALENVIQDWVVNLAGMGFAGGGVGGLGAGGGGAHVHLVGPGFPIHGNPRDYAWGRGGLDTIITMLLNQVDGAGPPPMDRDNIQEIPTVKITEQQVQSSGSCSVCWEDFSVGEELKQLECDHFFHGPCIIPWLELHGTCPVCRKVLNPAAVRGEHEHQTDTPDTPSQVTPSTPTPTPPPPAPAATSTPIAPPPPPQAAGGGGPFGLIVSALNQVFNYPSRSSQSQSSAAGDVSSNTSSTVDTSSETNTANSNAGSRPVSSGATRDPGSGTSRDNGSNRDTDEETPVSRRPRLDSDLVDFDLE